MEPAAEIRQLRERLLSLIIPDTTGMSLHRVYSFLRREGIPLTPWVAVAAKDRALITKACMDTGLIHDNITDPKYNGMSLYVLQFSLVFRGSSAEQHLGPKYAEAVAVHELMHGSGNLPVYLHRRSDGKIIQRRFGLIIDGEGHFFEEALAHLMDQKYTTNVLGLRRKYKRLNRVPSTGLNLLIRRDRRLWPALRAAHAGAPLEQAASIIDAVGGTGLFEYLYKLRPGDQDATRGIAAIRDALGIPERRLYRLRT